VNADEFPNIKAVHERDVARGIRKPPAPNLSPSQLKLVGYTDEEIAARRSRL